MQIFLPEKIGFCFGVKRALKLTLDEIKRDGKVYILGDLIHNPQVAENLQRRGIKSITSLSQIKEGTLIIRSHGEDPSIISQARERKLRVLDTTCPYVLRVQKIVRSLSQESYQVIIIGTDTHPEVKGVIANVKKGGVYVVKNSQETEKLPFLKKAGIVAQTTENIENFSCIVKSLIEKTHECRVFNTICRIIRERQEETRKLAREVEAVIVVGGHNSSNTHQLVKLCQTLRVKTCFVEKEEDLSMEEWKGIKRVGITGGTSTPKEVIEKIKNKLLTTK